MLPFGHHATDVARMMICAPHLRRNLVDPAQPGPPFTEMHTLQTEPEP
jgi:hypothetical protein